LPPAPKSAIVKTEPPRVEPPPLPKPVAVAEPAVTAEPSKAQVSADNVPAAPGDAALVAKVETPKVELLPPPTPSVAESAKSARHTSTGESSLIRALGLKINRVVIDPGHGGHDQGTTGPKGLLEKDLVLDVSKRLGKLIEDGLGAEVIYTRSDDTFVPLEGRTALANEKRADLFLSIHANSSSLPRVSGIETYYLNFTDSKDALDVASRENASSQKSVFELRDIIQKITLHDKAEESREFAGRIQTSLYALSARNLPGERNRGVRKAPFVVLIGANMPSVLAEIGFLSNPKEEALLKKPEYRQKLAESLYRGLSRYAEGLSHFQMALN
jgi:N-acetylmuramoyl-L-alanine amidase